MRLLERLDPDKVPVGYDGPPGREAVRFASWLSLSFPPSALRALAEEADGPPRLTIAHFGLVGTTGVLPRVITESLIQWRREDKDRTVSDFLDLFHHRVASLFHRAWAKYHVPRLFEREREGSSPREEPFSGPIFALMGLGSPELRGRIEGTPDDALARHAATFARRHRNAQGLEHLIADQFGVTTTVVPFAGRWLTLGADDVSRLSARGADRRQQMGGGLVLGRRAWDVASTFRLRLGPLDRRQFEALAPDQPAARALQALVRFHIGSDLDFEVQRVLRSDQVPSCRLGNRGESARLGRSAWMLGKPAERDRDEAIARP